MITGWGPDLSPEALGYPVTAFLTLEIRQGGHGRPRRRRRPPRRHPRGARGATRSPAPATCGPASWRAPTPTSSGSSTWCSPSPGIVRSTTVIALATQIPYRVRPARRREAARVSLSRVGDGAAAAAITLGTATTSLVDGAVERDDADAGAQARPRPAPGRPGRGRPACSSPRRDGVRRLGRLATEPDGLAGRALRAAGGGRRPGRRRGSRSTTARRRPAPAPPRRRPR